MAFLSIRTRICADQTQGTLAFSSAIHSLFEIHNVTSFADRDSTGKIIKYPVLLKMEGHKLSAIAVDTGAVQDNGVAELNEHIANNVVEQTGAEYNEPLSSEDQCRVEMAYSTGLIDTKSFS